MDTFIILSIRLYMASYRDNSLFDNYDSKAQRRNWYAVRACMLDAISTWVSKNKLEKMSLLDKDIWHKDIIKEAASEVSSLPKDIKKVVI